MGVGKGLEFYVLMHIEFAIPRKIMTWNNAFLRHHSCRLYQDQMFYLFIQMGMIIQCFVGEQMLRYVLETSGPGRMVYG